MVEEVSYFVHGNRLSLSRVWKSLPPIEASILDAVTRPWSNLPDVSIIALALICRFLNHAIRSVRLTRSVTWSAQSPRN